MQRALAQTLHDAQHEIQTLMMWTIQAEQALTQTRAQAEAGALTTEQARLQNQDSLNLAQSLESRLAATLEAEHRSQEQHAAVLEERWRKQEADTDAFCAALMQEARRDVAFQLAKYEKKIQDLEATRLAERESAHNIQKFHAEQLRNVRAAQGPRQDSATMVNECARSQDPVRNPVIKGNVTERQLLVIVRSYLAIQWLAVNESKHGAPSSSSVLQTREAFVVARNIQAIALLLGETPLSPALPSDLTVMIYTPTRSLFMSSTISAYSSPISPSGISSSMSSGFRRVNWRGIVDVTVGRNSKQNFDVGLASLSGDLELIESSCCVCLRRYRRPLPTIHRMVRVYP